jgi:hypothetical protein
LGQLGQLGPLGGQRILVTPEVAMRWAACSTARRVRFGGAPFQITGLQQDMHNAAGFAGIADRRARQPARGEAIELVAMLFDFIFETATCRTASRRWSAACRYCGAEGGVRSTAFFPKSHPSRLLSTRWRKPASAGAPTMGQDDPLYRKIEKIVRRPG